VHLVGFYYKNKARTRMREKLQISEKSSGLMREIKHTEQTMESGSRGKKR